MTTVRTVPGMFSVFGPLVGQPDVIGPFYRRECTTVGAVLPARVAPGWPPVDLVADVKYRNWRLFGQVDGMKKIDQALHAAPADEPVVVMTHSMGSYSAWLWLRDYAPTSSIDPARVVFLMAGVAGDMKDAPHLINSRYRIIDVIRQWEQFSDPPDVKASPFYQLAKDNTERLDLHTRGYRDVSLHAEPAMQNTRGSITYLFYPTFEAPAVAASREQIESAYDRRYLHV